MLELKKIELGSVETGLVSLVPIQFARKAGVLPLYRRRDESGREVACVAVADPLDIYSVEDVGRLIGMPVEPVRAPRDEIDRAINHFYEKQGHDAAELVSGLKQDIDDEESLSDIAHELESPTDLIEQADEAPIIRLINTVFRQAVKDKASDIHVEPFERELKIRFRIDGILHDVVSPPKRLQPLVSSRIKIMAGLNIAEKRLPQDGRIRLVIAGRDIDIRVSTIPTLFGERIVLRLLDRASILMGLADLGMEGETLARFNRAITQSHGIVLVTGPTGSGKTTTLYAALNSVNSPDKNIITVEDPVEYQLHGIGQIPVNPKINLTFAAGLRAILRQDPDIIMVGEIRDLETAEIAIQSALTGHLVFSTLHTNDAPSAVTRLIDMGVEPFLVSSSVVAVVAQRLARKLCVSCRERYVPSAEECRELGLPAGGTAYRARGCPDCANTGYRGQSGLFEMMVIDDSIRARITGQTAAHEIKAVALLAGMRTLRDDGARAVSAGITSVEEVLRVTQQEA